MIENIKITKAEYNDLNDILALQKIAFLSEAEFYNDYTIEPLTQSLDSIHTDFEDYIFLKALCGNEIIGSVKARETGDFCYVGRLIVKPEFQNKGVGKKLLAEIEREFTATKQYLLFTESKSIKNIKLYESVGYKTREEFIDERNPNLIFIKMIKENIIK
jgi:ribosomal protein S18 acetylase RimI-like enzyme